MIAPYDYHAPTELREALELLRRYGEDAHVMAGGVSLVLLMEQGLVRPGHVVGLRGIAALRGIARDPDGALRIGATVTHREAEVSPLVREHCAALAETFAHVATIRIRNQGTVGGNLAHADPAQDPPPMLLALDAAVRVAGAGGAERTVALDGFFTDVFETSLRPAELITSVRVPRLPAGSRAAYLKFLPRTLDDYATVSVAAVLASDAGGTCTHARIALGAVGPVAFRAKQAEAALVGRRVDARTVTEAAELAAAAADPLDDLRGPAAYKRRMAAVWTARALRQVARLD